jgi:thiamine-monophosphate kinase
VPRDLSRKKIDEIGLGLNAGARQYGAYVVGGDTGEASDLIIGISLFGIGKKNELVLRNGARLGDIVAVTGPFGKTSAGLKILLNRLEVPKEISRILVESVLMPQARLDEGVALARSQAVTAAIDSSDGLAWSLHEIARASRVGITLDKLPIANEVERFAETNKLVSSDLGLYGGEEYELVVTVKPQLWDSAKEAVRSAGGDLMHIGRVTAAKGVFLKTFGKRVAVECRGYEHFKV